MARTAGTTLAGASGRDMLAELLAELQLVLSAEPWHALLAELQLVLSAEACHALLA